MSCWEFVVVGFVCGDCLFYDVVCFFVDYVKVVWCGFDVGGCYVGVVELFDEFFVGGNSVGDFSIVGLLMIMVLLFLNGRLVVVDL